jgi:hypothetical protein
MWSAVSSQAKFAVLDKMSKKKRLSKRTDQPEKRAEREPVVGIEPTANGLQI